MLARFGRATKTFAVQSVSFDHAVIGKLRLNGPPSANPNEITLVIAASPAMQAEFKPSNILGQVDLILYITDAAGHQRFRSQLELAKPVVADYKLSEDKKTATVKLSAKAALLSEQRPSTNTDWVTSG